MSWISLPHSSWEPSVVPPMLLVIAATTGSDGVERQPGDCLYEFIGPTYGCIGPEGIAATVDPSGDYPFFEVNRKAIIQT